MLTRPLLLAILLPATAFGQSFVGSYRAVFVDLFSGNKIIVAEWEVSADRSLIGTLKVDGSEKSFSSKVEENGKFEAVIEQSADYIYKLKGKFDGEKKISLVHREQAGSESNKSVSERAIEGTISKVKTGPREFRSSGAGGADAGVTDIGKSRIEVRSSQPIFGAIWSDFAASVSFNKPKRMPIGDDHKEATETGESLVDAAINVSSKGEGQQTLMINIPNYSPGKKIWRQSELGAASYREVKGEQRNSFITGATFQTDPRYADGEIEVVRENESLIVFKLTNFKIKKFNKEDFVTLDGFIYADK
ncbi:MAG: hypothetical protein QUS14_08840 [Pyrinomonadaceae bacterium]|nr:hypothetical protein [Pyrinomonadaceae bacterium]